MLQNAKPTSRNHAPLTQALFDQSSNFLVSPSKHKDLRFNKTLEESKSKRQEEKLSNIVSGQPTQRFSHTFSLPKHSGKMDQAVE